MLLLFIQYFTLLYKGGIMKIKQLSEQQRSLIVPGAGWFFCSERLFSVTIENKQYVVNTERTTYRLPLCTEATINLKGGIMELIITEEQLLEFKDECQETAMHYEDAMFRNGQQDETPVMRQVQEYWDGRMRSLARVQQIFEIEG